MSASQSSEFRSSTVMTPDTPLSTSQAVAPASRKSPFPKFQGIQIHPSLARFAIPLSQLSEKPINAKKENWVGLIIVGKSTRVKHGDNLRNRIGGGDERAEGASVDSSQPKLVPSPTALLLRPQPSPSLPYTSVEELKPTSTPHARDDWDLPSIPIGLDVDSTLLDSVDRCAREMTGRGVREISRCLGRREIVLSADGRESVGGGAGDAGSKGESHLGLKAISAKVRQAVRYDFMVKLFPGPIVVPVGKQGRWAGTEESFRVMCRLPKEAVLVRSE